MGGGGGVTKTLWNLVQYGELQKVFLGIDINDGRGEHFYWLIWVIAKTFRI